jgi:hypothetical protein
MIRGMKVRGRRLWTIAALVLGVVLVALWLVRDLPRYRVASILGDRLDASVRVGKLVIHGSQHFELQEITIKRIRSQPWLERVTIAQAVVRGSLTEIQNGLLDELSLVGVVVQVVPPDPDHEPPPATDADVVIEHLTMTGSQIRLITPSGTSTIAAEAEMHWLGGPKLLGRLQLAGDTVSLPVLQELAGISGPRLEGSLHGLAATVETDDGANLMIEVTADKLSVAAGGESMVMDGPRLYGSGYLGTGSGSISFDLGTYLHETRTGTILASYDPGQHRLSRLRIMMDRLQLADWLGFGVELPPGWQLSGTASIMINAPSGAGSMVGLVYPRDLQLTGTRSDGSPFVIAAEVDLTISLASGAQGWQGRVEADFEVTPQAPALPALQGQLAAELSTEPPAASGSVTIDRLGSVQGNLEASGSLALDEDNQVQLDIEWRWVHTLSELLELAAASGWSPPETGPVRAVVEADGALSGSLLAPLLTGRFVITDPELLPADDPWSVRIDEAVADLSWQLPDQAPEMTLSIPDILVRKHHRAVLRGQVAATAGADLQARRIDLSSALIYCGSLGRLDGHGQWRAGQPWSLQVALSGIELSAWQDLYRDRLGAHLAEAVIAGTAAADLAITGTGLETWSGDGTASLDGLGYSSPDGSRVIEGLALSSEVHLGLDSGQAAVSAGGQIQGPLLLWNTVFADLSSRQAGIRLEAELPLGAGHEHASGWHGGLDCRLDPSSTISISAAGGAPSELSLEIRLALDDLQSTVTERLRQPLQGSVPALDRLQVAGSVQAHALASVTGERLALAGELELHRVSAGTDDGILRVSELELELPLDLVRQKQSNGTMSIGGDTRKGWLSCSSLSAAGLTMPATAVPLEVSGDTIAVDGRLSLPVVGGYIHLEGLTMAELLRPSRHLQTAVHLDHLQLAELSRALDLVPLQGELEGSFARVSLTPDSLRVEGDGRLSVFGGIVTVTDISGSDVLSRYPHLQLSTSFSGIDLAQVTGIFDFGEMSGILAGEVRDCELFRGVPIRFHGHIETVPVPGVKQVISLKAINNIAIVGTGGQISLLDRGIHRLLRRYSYQSIGLQMKLENDRFLLRGLEHRGDKELFLKGRAPFRIDVVNVQPGTTVSFQTMLERLRNLDIATIRAD